MNPYNIRNNGVLLSFGGTIGIICFLSIINKPNTNHNLALESSKINKIKNKIINYAKNIFCVSFSAQIILIPIIAYNYKTISLTFFITNILTSSLIGLIIIFGFIIILISFIFFDISKLLGLFYNVLIKLLLFITENTSKIPFSKIYVKMPYIYEIILYYIFIFTIFYLYKKYGKDIFFIKIKRIIKKYHKKIIAVLLIFILIFLSINYIPKKLRVYFIDVGQGDSCLIITPKNTKILIDGGGSESYDVGGQILLPYILSRRITKIDYIICSHFDTDHCGGIKTILENLKVKNLVISKQKEQYDNFKEIIEIARKKKVNIIVVKAKDILKFDKSAYMKILYPTEPLSHDDINNNSIVGKFICDNTSILFTGDIEKVAEENILKLYDKKELKSDILKAGHHGSKTSSTAEFIEAVSPKIVLIGVRRK